MPNKSMVAMDGFLSIYGSKSRDVWFLLKLYWLIDGNFVRKLLQHLNYAYYWHKALTETSDYECYLFC